MKIRQLETAAFRNLHDQVLEPGARLNVIHGDNGQGKTNLLEAIFLVSCLRSFRGRRVSELIRFDGTRARVRALVEHEELSRELAVEISGEGKRVFLDGKARRGSGYLGQLRAIIFQPEDLWLPRGSPADRRRLLDGAITVIWPAYLKVLRDYQRVLQHRNHLLRRGAAPDEQMLEVYEQQLAELGAKVVASRRRYLAGLSQGFGSAFGGIFRWEVRGSLSYASRAAVLEGGDRVDELIRVLRRELGESRRVDRLRQTTTVGPHTDDMDFQLDGRSARSFGSQGQVRGLMLAFRMAQMQDAYLKGGCYPVLLLDDVSSELDPTRSQRLFEFIEEIPSQTFVTTTRAALIPLTGDRMDFQVVDGAVAGSARDG